MNNIHVVKLHLKVLDDRNLQLNTCVFLFFIIVSKSPELECKVPHIKLDFVVGQVCVPKFNVQWKVVKVVVSVLWKLVFKINVGSLVF